MFGSVTVSVGQPGSGLSSFDWVALYAAVVATVAVIIEVVRWLKSGVQLSISATAPVLVMGDEDERDWLHVEIVNRGDLRTTLTGITLHRRTRWERWFRWIGLKASRPAAVITEWGFRHQAYTLPASLEPGTRWTALLKWDVTKALNDQPGSLYLGVSSTHSAKVILVPCPAAKKS